MIFFCGLLFFDGLECFLCFFSRVSAFFSALKQHYEKKKHKSFSSTLQKVKGKENVEEADKPKCTDSQKVLQDFFVKSSTSTSKATASSVETRPSDFAEDSPSTLQTTVTEVVWTLPQLVANAGIIAALQYASQNIPYSCADTLQECYKQQFPDSAIAKHVSLGTKKMLYMVAYGLGPYFQQATVKEIIQGNSYFTVHFDETECSSEKAYGLISALLEESKEIKVRYLASIMLGHAKADTVVHEMLKT